MKSIIAFAFAIAFTLTACAPVQVNPPTTPAQAQPTITYSNTRAEAIEHEVIAQSYATATLNHAVTR